MNTYEVIGVFHYEKNGEQKTIIHYLKPILNKNGSGFSGEKAFLNEHFEIQKGDMIRFIFDLGYDGKAYIQAIEKVD